MLQTTTNAVNGASYTYTSTATGYAWWDGAVQSSITHDSDTVSGSNALWITSFTLGGSGQTTYAWINDGKPRSVTFKLDELGQILRRDETRPSQAPATQVGSPHEVWYRFADREWGFTGNNATLNVSATRAIDQRQLYRAPASTGTYRNGATTAAPVMDFTRGSEQLNTWQQGSDAGGYTVRSGDTLQSIAQGLYGDSSLWYKIAEINGLSGGSSLIAGTQLQLPAGVTRNSYNAKTYAPYDPSAAMGDLSPTTPKKPPQCGMMGMVLLAAIAIAVVAIAGPAIIGAAAVGTAGTTGFVAATGLTAVLGSTGAGIVGGAIAGALGSVVSQGVGVATGIQDKFSFKAVAMAAIGGGIGGGLSGFNAFGTVAANAGQSLQAIGNAAVRGVLSSFATQGIAKATGLQSSFSWAGVAAAGVSAGVGQGLGGNLAGTGPGGDNSIGNLISHTAVGAASLFASAATRSALTGSSFGRNIIAGLPDVIGQVVGRALAGAAMGGGNDAVGEAAQSLAENLIAQGRPEEAARVMEIASQVGVNGTLELLNAGSSGDGVVAFDSTSDQQRAGAEAAEADMLRQGKTPDEARAAYHDVARLISLKEDVAAMRANVGSTNRAVFNRFERVFNLGLLAKDAYFSRSIAQLLPDGYSVYSSSNVAGLTTSSENGYFSRLYRNGNTIYMASRGTDDGGAWYEGGVFASDRDGDTNAATVSAQLSPQHRLAGDNASLLVSFARENGLSVHFVGHSLGGSLAAFQALLTGQRATIFNSLGLNVRTMELYINDGRLNYRNEQFTTTEGFYGSSRVLQISDRARNLYSRHRELIDSYYTASDSVTSAQRLAGISVVGTPRRLADARYPGPSTHRTVRSGGLNGEISRPRVQPVYTNDGPHSMNSVLYSLFSRVSSAAN